MVWFYSSCILYIWFIVVRIFLGYGYIENIVLEFVGGKRVEYD